MQQIIFIMPPKLHNQQATMVSTLIHHTEESIWCWK